MGSSPFLQSPFPPTEEESLLAVPQISWDSSRSWGQQSDKVIKGHVQVDERGGCQPGLLASRQFPQQESPPLPVSWACLSSFPPNFLQAHKTEQKGEKGKKPQTALQNMSALPSWSLAACTAVCTCTIT